MSFESRQLIAVGPDNKPDLVGSGGAELMDAVVVGKSPWSLMAQPGVSITDKERITAISENDKMAALEFAHVEPHLRLCHLLPLTALLVFSRYWFEIFGFQFRSLAACAVDDRIEKLGRSIRGIPIAERFKRVAH